MVPVVGEFVALMDEFEILKPCLGQGIMKRFIQNPYLAYRTIMNRFGYAVRDTDTSTA